MARTYGQVPVEAYDAIKRLHTVTGLTYAQIAEAFQCSASRIRQIAKGYVSYVTPAGNRSSKPAPKEAV